MRAIKFRGKSINGEWHYGLLSISQGKPGQPEAGYYISNSAGMPWAYQVIPETVGQYTGVNDKNNKEIYEGTILKVDKDFPKDSNFFKVQYVDFLACYKAVGLKYSFPLHFKEFRDYEVIGNIVDNPELLLQDEAV